MTSSSTDPRRERTRSALIAAGLTLFAERAPEAVTIDRIVETAGVGKGSFYNHFSGREALLQAIANRLREDVEDRIAEANSGVGDAAVRMARANCCYYRFAIEQRERARFAVRVGWPMARPDRRLDEGLQRDLARGMESRRFNVASAGAGIVLVQGVVREAVATLLDSPNDARTGATLCELVAMVLLGLGVERAESRDLASAAVERIVMPALCGPPR